MPREADWGSREAGGGTRVADVAPRAALEGLEPDRLTQPIDRNPRGARPEAEQEAEQDVEQEARHGLDHAQDWAAAAAAAAAAGSGLYGAEGREAGAARLARPRAESG